MKRLNVLVGSVLLLCGFAVCSRPEAFTKSEPPTESATVVIPKLWNTAALSNWATPLVGGFLPDYVSPEDYYAAPVDNLRTYPVYHPDREPPGYWHWLHQQKPQPLIEIGVARTEAKWVAAGKRVFEELDEVDARTSDPAGIAWMRDPKKISEHQPVMTKDGQFPFFRWVVDTDNVLKLSVANCALCHSRVMPDGSLLNGAPGNLFEWDFSGAAIDATGRAEEEYDKRHGAKMTAEERFYANWGVPWLKDDIHIQAKKKWAEDQNFFWESMELGTMDRPNGSFFWINKIADLIGVRDRRYLDATGTHANRGPEDIARYGVLVEYADTGSFGGHTASPKGKRLTARLFADRPPDEAMYALGHYLYSLDYPPNPNPFDDLAKRGQKIFEAEGCTECHTPPLYTNNKLVRAPGFDPPEGDQATQRLNISLRRVGTDAGLATKTRKGTGYYKIPMLRGLWYRGLYEHSGSVAALEDWFDPKRLREDYVPTGWKGPGVKTRAVPGHKFGHDLSDEDKKALIAFLKTL